jgi:homoaconitase/3-isopropylmalate dehydratase large subunit
MGMTMAQKVLAAPSDLDTVVPAQHRLGFRRVADVGKGSIEHQVTLEEPLAVPGQLVASNDSHTGAARVLNCAARGLGMADIVRLVCTRRTRYRVSPSGKFELHGRLPFGVYGKDVFLQIASAPRPTGRLDRDGGNGMSSALTAVRGRCASSPTTTSTRTG